MSSPSMLRVLMDLMICLAAVATAEMTEAMADRTFRVTKDGYDNVERLYIWCYRNKSRIWAWVETYRLNHGID